MYAERGPAYSCAGWLQALQYTEETFAWKYNAATKWAQSMHVSTLAFQTPLLVEDTSDNENKKRQREYGDRGKGKGIQKGEGEWERCCVNNLLKKKKEGEDKQMEIKTMVKWSCATWISAADSKLCQCMHVSTVSEWNVLLCVPVLMCECMWD